MISCKNYEKYNRSTPSMARYLRSQWDRRADTGRRVLAPGLERGTYDAMHKYYQSKERGGSTALMYCVVTGSERELASAETSADSVWESQTHLVFEHRGKSRDWCSSWRHRLLRQDNESPLWGAVHGPLSIHADTRGTRTGWRKTRQGTYTWCRVGWRLHPHPEDTEDATGKLSFTPTSLWIW